MITVSLCMIVKNEEDTLERCLNCAKDIADEIVIADTGSTDRTKEIALGFTEKVYDFEWIDDFSAARNFSYSHAAMDYILWLDADDILLPEDAAKLKALKESLPANVDAVMMRYNTGFNDDGEVVFSWFRERLSKRIRNFKWREPVHEYLEIIGKTINSDICVTHAKPHERQSARNLKIYESLIAEGKPLSARGMYYYARELKDNGRYADAIIRFSMFLDSDRGWLEDNISACGDLAKCYLAENKPREALSAMLRSFSYDNPRAETCCQIGYYFKNHDQYKQAAFWFGLALSCEGDKTGWGFKQKDCYGYIPCIELAVCYDKLGMFEKAARFNDMAYGFKPYSSSVLYNKQYFENKLAGLSGTNSAF